jgi:hypothetical protein
MSSGTKSGGYDGKWTAMAASQQVTDPSGMGRTMRLGMSPRQQQLNYLWSFYRCAQYDARKIDWDGKKALDPVEHEAVSTGSYIPPGYYDPADQMTPLKFRRPSAPYHIIKVIVDRFTGMMFGQSSHPRIVCEGDELTTDYIMTLIEVSRLWPAMMQARNYGGAMGTAVVGFKFVDGKPIIEVHDPRWVRTQFVDRGSLKLAAIDKRFMYPQEVFNEEVRAWETQWFWYRRRIDQETDIVFKAAPVGQGDEPEWQVEEIAQHNLGFCPVVWIQNLPNDDDIDGIPDAEGVYDISKSLDALLAQGLRGTLANCDPTVHVGTDLPLDSIKKGSDNCIKTEKGGTVEYVEIDGTGPEAAYNSVATLRKLALEVAQCVADIPAGGRKTATEVEYLYAPMLSKTDILREQYGERGIKVIVDMMLKAVRQLKTSRDDGEGNLVSYELKLPPKILKENGETRRIERQLGEGNTLDLVWPPYFRPSLTDVMQAAQAAVTAKVGGLIDDENAIQFISTYFDVEDPVAMLNKLQKQKLNDQHAIDDVSIGKLPLGTNVPRPDKSEHRNDTYGTKQSDE